jgi:CheY-like chemotaxis protein
MKLLIAEDDVLFRNILLRILAPEYELIFAHDGDQAWAALQHPDAPRLAILDWVMPGLSGPQICRNVRGCERLSSMYLILFTARNSTADVTSGLRAGADDYITKPFHAEALRERVRFGENTLMQLDAFETGSTLISRVPAAESAARENPTGWPFFLGPSVEDDPYTVGDCVIGSFPLASPSNFSELDGSPYPLRQHSLEKLHA